MKTWMATLAGMFMPAIALAQTTEGYDTIVEGLGVTARTAGLETSFSLSFVVAQLINVLLSVLGIVFLILVVYAGVMYMTASGDSEKTKKAMSLIVNAIVGLMITLGAYAITTFVFGQLGNIGT